MDIRETQEERGKTYGEFKDHMQATSVIMEELRKVNLLKDEEGFDPKFEVALFYMVTKMVRLATSPDHEDSALDLSSYADLWLKEVQNENKSSTKIYQDLTTQER